MQANTGVRFETKDPLLSQLVKQAEEKCRLNIKNFGGDPVLVEGGGYEKIWLETQPMGGAMYASRDFATGLNNSLMFMRHQRADGRIPGSIAVIDGKVVPQFNKFQGFCFPEPALDLYYLGGKDAEYLAQLAKTLEAFDAYLWRVRDSDGDGCLETWCKYDTGEDHAMRYADAPDPWEEETPPQGCTAVPIASMDVMSYSYACRETLAEIARISGDAEAQAQWAAKAKAVQDKMVSYLWDDARGAMFDRDKNHNQMPTLIHNTLRCMYWHSLPDALAERFVKEHLLNPQEFWTKMPLPSVVREEMSTLFSLVAAAKPAITLAPKELTTLWMMILPTETKLCCKMLGMATTAIWPSIFQENQTRSPSLGTARTRRATTHRESTQLTPWHKKVAQATPATPRSKAATNSTSTAMFAVEEPARNRNGVRLSPSAVKMPVATL